MYFFSQPVKKAPHKSWTVHSMLGTHALQRKLQATNFYSSCQKYVPIEGRGQGVESGFGTEF
ncbi:hypothetical protein D3OALGA1CA_5864 [Olavius algarvensis associated proteobacterium Delta 3]|nr:hypothetical protein D3OALGB2SA_1296 [Olavius algarvensis associated proteobacterium Delta 3]CAB5172779.1 hypothetical protein D3OALGA1CA_5864 [Olavius algarvensis associated proteobacterium Delta 3]